VVSTHGKTQDEDNTYESASCDGLNLQQIPFEVHGSYCISQLQALSTSSRLSPFGKTANFRLKVLLIYSAIDIINSWRAQPENTHIPIRNRQLLAAPFSPSPPRCEFGASNMLSTSMCTSQEFRVLEIARYIYKCTTATVK
jgi:hypothetical protein